MRTRHPFVPLALLLALCAAATEGRALQRENDLRGQALAAAPAAGASIVKEAQDTFCGGYAGYFRDPDGHLWEVVWNPSFGGAE